MSTSDPASPTDDVVEVRTPADGAFVSTLRLAAASLATRCELTIDDIEDLRLAVDEACSLLLPHAVTGSTLTTRFALSRGRLAVEASVTTLDDATPDRTGFAWTVLGALASSVDVRKDGDELTISVVKGREAATR